MHFSGLFRPGASSAALPASARAERYARAALDRECAEVARTTGRRNERLNRAAHALGQFVGAAVLDESEVITALMDAATACGHIQKRGARATLATVRSGLRAGIALPRDIPAPAHGDHSLPEPRHVDLAEEARREHERELARLARQAEDQIKAERVRMWWDRAIDPRGTLAERYLRVHRGLELPDAACGYAIRSLADGSLRGERGPLMICAFRDIYTDEVVGLHRTLIDSATSAKRARAMLGRAKGAAIKLTPDDTLSHGLHIAEGVETALAGMMLGMRPMWAMGSTSGIKKFPVLGGVECLTILGEAGTASADAIDECGARWSAAGREVLISEPLKGSDLADAFRPEAA